MFQLSSPIKSNHYVFGLNFYNGGMILSVKCIVFRFGGQVRDLALLGVFQEKSKYPTGL